MNVGRTVVGSFDQDGKHYEIVCQLQIDVVYVWHWMLYEGVDTWKVPSAIGAVMAMIDEVGRYATPEEEVQKRVIDPINTFLKNKFQGGVVVMPTTWIGQIDALLDKVIFFRDAANMPQVKVNL